MTRKVLRMILKLLEDTIAGNAETVAKAIGKIHDTQYAPTFYNNEQALRYVIKFAYIAALVIDLKWNKSSEGAIHQIKKNNFPAILRDYGGEVVIAGINYDAKAKEHSCIIERV